MLFYSVWSLAWYYLVHHYFESPDYFKAAVPLKVLSFLSGVFLSLTFKESLGRYRSCLGALTAFRDELRSFWYFCQLQSISTPAARLIFSLHMIAYSVSLIRHLLRAEGEDEHEAYEAVPQQFEECILFQRTGVYFSILSSPMYAETLLMSWCRTLGIMDRETRMRWDWVRRKQRTLVTSQKVLSPKTASHLLDLNIHLFLCLVPVCNSNLAITFATPLIAVLMLSVLTLGAELEDPFGIDDHDLPWPLFFSTISRCIPSSDTEPIVQETLLMFNKACAYGYWDPAHVSNLFGYGALDNVGPRTVFDNGAIHLRVYMLEQDLMDMNVVGDVDIKGADILFSDDGVVEAPYGLATDLISISEDDDSSELTESYISRDVSIDDMHRPLYGIR